MPEAEEKKTETLDTRAAITLCRLDSVRSTSEEWQEVILSYILWGCSALLAGLLYTMYEKTSGILVAAIDFGTTYSGWAYSSNDDYNREPTTVFAKKWLGGNNVSEKAPTTVLIEPDGKKLKAFGYEAEDRYADLAEKGEHNKWYYFRRFKMLLMDKIDLERCITIEDETGKKLPAKLVFSMAIKYLKDDLLEECKTRVSGLVQSEDIMWVLTVPSIWNDSAKQFMREAAVEAGIETNKLKIALEPETASVFCRHLPIDRMVGKVGFSKMAEGSKYMVIDAGGGTVDITVHQIVKGGKLKEVHKVSGGAWGGTRVDENYKQFLISIVGNSVFQNFVNNQMEDYIAITREFEVKKRMVDPESDLNEEYEDAKVTIRIPWSLREMLKKETGQTIEEAIEQSKFSGQIQHFKDKIRVDATLIRSFFEEATQSMVDHVNKLFLKPAVTDVSEILLVGAFSESKIIQCRIRRNFPTKKIVVPQEAGLVVLKGAVVFGHDTGAVIERIAKYTYGVEIQPFFEEDKHDEDKKFISADGVVRCRGVFRKYVEKEQTLRTDGLEFHGYKPIESSATTLMVKLFASNEKNPKYVTDESCFKIGEMKVDVNTTVPFEKREFAISLTIGDTEIHMKAFEESTKLETTCSLNFLH